jgi:hypothetical protein
MKRLLSTTALVLAMTGGAHAQNDASGFDAVEMQQGDFYGSNLIGMRIYNSENPVDAEATIADGGEAEWDDIGEINDIIVTKDGQVSAVILGVGGFLGMGERDVAVPMDAITVVREQDGEDRFLVVSTSKEALEQMPAFERGEAMTETQDNAENTASDDTATSGDTTMSDDGTTTDDSMATDDTAETDDTMATDDTAETDDTMATDDAAETDDTMATDDTAETDDTMATDDTAETDDTMATDDTTVVTTDDTDAGDDTTVITTDDTAASDDTMEQTDETVAVVGGLPEREMLPRPAVTREGYAEVETDAVRQLTSEDLEGTLVYGADDESVGEIDSLIIGPDATVEGVVINVGGFLGLGEKPVAVTFDELQILRQEGGDDLRIYIDSTEERLEAQPEYND